MNVLLVMEPLIGGTLRHLEGLVAGLDPARVRLTLAVSFGRDPAVRRRAADWRASGAEVVEVPMQRQPSPPADLAALVRLRRIIGRGGFDVVHTHSAKAGFLGRLAARSLGFRGRIVHTPHVLPFQQAFSGVSRAVYGLCERRAAAWTDTLVCLSRYQRLLAMQALDVPPERLALIPNGINLDWFRPMDRGEARGVLGLDRASFVVAFVGRPVPQKGLDVLAEAVGRLAIPGLTVLQAGGGGQPAGWPPAAAFRALGVLDDVRPVYAAADVVAVPSRFEGLPYVILEAAAMARPVVAAGFPGVLEIVEHGRTGLVAIPGDSFDLAARIQQLADDPAFARRLGEAAADAVGRFALDRQIEALMAVYRGG